MFRILIVVILCVPLIQAQENGVIETNNNTECINKLLQWCNGMQANGGISMLSVSYHDGTGFHRVFCSSDTNGTNCTRNGSPWYGCTSDHTLMYKGEVLSNNSGDGDVCEATSFIQSFSYNATMREVDELSSFFEEIAAMQQRIRELTKRLSSGSFLDDNFWEGMGDIFSGGHNSETTVSYDNSSSEDKNQIEKE